MRTASVSRSQQHPPDAWRRYLPAVRHQALNLARRGRLTILRKGKPVDPHAPFKGVVRLGRAAEGVTPLGKSKGPA